MGQGTLIMLVRQEKMQLTAQCDEKHSEYTQMNQCLYEGRPKPQRRLLFFMNAELQSSVYVAGASNTFSECVFQVLLLDHHQHLSYCTCIFVTSRNTHICDFTIDLKRGFTANDQENSLSFGEQREVTGSSIQWVGSCMWGSMLSCGRAWLLFCHR